MRAYLSKPSTIIIGILLLAFLLRIIGINYGLPLWVVADEPPFVYAPLKMIELKTLIPGLHPEEFADKFYFPPFLAYMNMLIFIPILAVWYFFANVSPEIFRLLIFEDASILYLAARFISVLAGVTTVWFVYKTAQALFKENLSSLISAFVMAVAFLPVNFSHWARHWTMVTMLCSATLWVLTRPWSSSKRYILASTLAGFAFGVNYQGGIIAILIMLWYLVYERFSPRLLFKTRFIWWAIIIFLILVSLAIIFYPQNLSLLSSNNLESFRGSARSAGGFFNSYLFFGRLMLITEPAILLGLILAIWRGVRARERFILTGTLFIFVYIALFYSTFFLQGRYILVAYPILALFCGYGFSFPCNFWPPLYAKIALILCLLLAIVPSVRFVQLLARDDSRIVAREWFSKNVPAGSKVVVMARLMRLPSTSESKSKQEGIDPDSLRSVDIAERLLSINTLKYPTYYALNLGTVSANSFYKDITRYIKDNDYEYVIFSPEFIKRLGLFPEDIPGSIVMTFLGYERDDNVMDLTNGFGGGLPALFRQDYNGPTIVIKKL